VVINYGAESNCWLCFL